MNKQTKSLRARLKQGEVLVGGWIQIPHPAVARLLAASGLDWIALDAEHGVLDVCEADVLLSAIRAAGCAPLVRMQGNAYAENKRYLDAGAEGVIAPLVNSRADAEALVRSTKYPPEGERGVGYCVANGYGFDFDAYIARANRDIVTCVQVEHVNAIENLDAILSVPGVDAAFIGPYDLSASLGVTAQFDHPRYQDALNRFIEGCKKHSVAAGIHVVQPNPEEVAKRVEEGYRMIAYSLDVTILGGGYRDGVARIRDLLGQSPVARSSS